MGGLLLVVLAWAGWRLLPSDEQAVRKLVKKMVQNASIRPHSSNLARLTYANRLADYFTPDATIHLEGVGAEYSDLHGRGDLVQAFLADRAQLEQADFTLADLGIKFPDGKKAASVYAAVTGHLNGKTNQFGQAFKMSLIKTNGTWLVAEMHTMEGLH